MINPLRMRILRCGLLLFCALVAQPTRAQQATIRGFVTDASTEQPLQGATVALRSDGVLVSAVATDGDGYFFIHRIIPDAYEIVISFVGFEPWSEQLQLVGNDTRDIRARLVPSMSEVGELVVEADAVGGITTVAAGLETIVPRAINRVPVPGVSGDLASYLQTVPGVTLQGDRGGQFFVRGGAVDQNLALLDGLPVYMPFHVVSSYSAFPEEVVDRAAFYTGGFGARYGGRASSILDVTARNGNKQHPSGSVSVAPFLSAITAEGPLVEGRVSVVLSARQSFVDQLMPNFLSQRMPYRFGDRFGKIHALIGTNNELSVTFLDTDDRGDIAGTKKSVFGDAQAAAITDTSEVAWDNRVYGGAWTFRSERLPVVSRISVGRSRMTNAFGPPGAPERFARIESKEAGIRLSWLLQRGDIAIGSTVRRTELEYLLDDLFTEYTTSQETLLEVQTYAEATLDALADRVSVNPGVHLYSLTERSQHWVEPRLRLSFWPTDRNGHHQLNASWGIYHQSLTGLTDERDLANLFTAWITTPEGEQPMRSVHAILGWSMRLRPSMSWAVEVFHKGYEHISAPVFSAFPQFTTSIQEARGVAYGADVRLSFEKHPFVLHSLLDGSLSYTWSNVEYEAGPYTYHPAHDRRHQVNAVVRAQRGEVGLTAQWQFGSGLPFTESGGFDKWYLLTPDVDVASEKGIDRIVYAEPFGGRQPTYARLDLWLERRVERGRYVGTLRAGALNLFNRANLFYYDLFTFSRVDQLPFIPSVGFKVGLR